MPALRTAVNFAEHSDEKNLRREGAPQVNAALFAAATVLRDAHQRLTKSPTDHRFADGLIAIALANLVAAIRDCDMFDRDAAFECADAMEACRWIGDVRRAYIASYLRQGVDDRTTIPVLVMALQVAASVQIPPPNDGAMLEDIANGLYEMKDALLEIAKQL